MENTTARVFPFSETLDQMRRRGYRIKHLDIRAESLYLQVGQAVYFFQHKRHSKRGQGAGVGCF